LLHIPPLEPRKRIGRLAVNFEVYPDSAVSRSSPFSVFEDIAVDPLPRIP
jgi:hypothetical protein